MEVITLAIVYRRTAQKCINGRFKNAPSPFHLLGFFPYVLEVDGVEKDSVKI